MPRIICITGWFRNQDTKAREFLVSHGIEEGTLKSVILPSEHPSRLGAGFDAELGEWVIDEPLQTEA
jgi:hypothetical protein